MHTFFFMFTNVFKSIECAYCKCIIANLLHENANLR